MNNVTYYQRAMNEYLVQKLNQDFKWLINYVIEHKELDFQTGSDRDGNSWFSVYRGASRILRIWGGKKGIISYDADKTYKEKAGGNELIEKFNTETREDELKKALDEYLKRIDDSKDIFGRYYVTSSGEKKEGYYQNLISRRYSFESKNDNPFFIIDKEFVLGFINRKAKDDWNKEIKKEIQKCLSAFVKEYNGRLPREIRERQRDHYDEVDFLALNWDGDIIIMELKQNDPSKTAFSPIQLGSYYRQFKKFLEEDKENDYMSVYKNIRIMIEQKISLGMIKIPDGQTLPSKLTGVIKAYLIVGENNTISSEQKKRYKRARKIFLPDIEAYQSKSDGEIERMEDLNLV